MVLFKGLAEVSAIKMSVYLRGCDAFMAHHLLYCSKVCPTLYEVRGKGMAECMGVYFLLEADLQGKSFEDSEDHDPCEHSPPAIEEENIFMTFFDIHVYAYVIAVEIDVLGGLFANRYEPLFVALADDFEKAYIEV